MPLSESAVDQIEELLFDEGLSEDTLDYFGLHGLVTSCVVGPIDLSNEQIINICFAEQDISHLSEGISHLRDCIEAIKLELREAISEGESIFLPFEDEDVLYDDALNSWCAGLVEGFLANEEAWFSSNDEVVAELLLPYMALSGLFDNEDFAPILENKKLMLQLESVVAEQLTDVFLFYHSKN